MSWRKKTFDELPALSVRGPELRRSLRIITLAWVFGNFWIVAVTGSRMTNFGRMAGFTDFDFGVLGALPFMATFAQLVAAILIERTGLRKYQFVQCTTIHRLLWLVIAAAPLVLPVPSRVTIVFVLVVFFISSFLASLGAPAWWTWMGDIIPRRIRGRYLANRAVVTAIVGLPVVIGLAVLLDRLTNHGQAMTRDAQPMLLYATVIIFSVGALLGALDILLFRRIKEVVRTRPDGLREPSIRIEVSPMIRKGIVARLGFGRRYAAAAIRQILIEPLSDRVFRRYVAFGATIVFAMTVAGQFFWRNALENLGFSQLGTDILFLVISPLVFILSARPLGRLIDRWGRRPVLMLGTFLTCFSVLPWFFAARDMPNPTFVVNGLNAAASALGGLVGRPEWQLVSPDAPLSAWLIMVLSPILGSVGWRAVALAQQGIILGFSDGPGGSKYVAASAVLISFGGVAGGLVGGTVAVLLAHFHYQAHPLQVGPFLWNNWHATFFLSFLARIGALLWLINMPDPGSGRARDMLRYMGVNVYNNVRTRIFLPLRVFGLLRPRRRSSRQGSDDLKGPDSPGGDDNRRP